MDNIKLPDIIDGKWHKKRYRILKQLGKGGVGQIFLAKSLEDDNYYAIKFSKDNLSINREFKFLKLFSDIASVVRTYEIDDFEASGGVVYFIVIDYIDGINLKEYTASKDIDTHDIIGLIIVIMNALEEFHRKGYVLADLKLENIMLDLGTKSIKLVDLGGVTKIGEGIKEYTPAYDRACWGRGIRRAEESYDFFSVLMLLTRILLKKNIDPSKQTLEEVIRNLTNANINSEVKRFLIKKLKSGENTKNFIKNLKDLYKVVKNYRKYEIIKRRDFAINSFLIASIFIFITTTIILWTRI